MLPSSFHSPSRFTRRMLLTPQQQSDGAAACTSTCCTCSVPMVPNAAKTCRRCLRASFSLRDGVPRHAVLVRCPACSSYLRPPRSWLRAAPESAELKQLLLRRVHHPIARLGATVAAAEFVSTEPQSKRIRLRLRIRREVPHASGVTMEQTHVVEYTVHDRLCDACGRARAGPDHWSTVVQVRQHASHRRTLLYLDQHVVRHGAADSAVRVTASPGALDFYFASRSHAERLVEFVSSSAPARVGTAKQLLSIDTRSNPRSFKHTISVELCPICRDDLILLSREASRELGGLGPLVLCVNVNRSIVLLDTNNMRVVLMGIKEYDRYKFEPMLSSRRLVEYVVVEVDAKPDNRFRHVPVLGSPYPMSWVQVARASDLGKNDTVFTVKTHIGFRLELGDHALGYDLCSVDSNNHDLEIYWQSHKLPDVVIVKKRYKRKKSASGKMQDGSDEGGCAKIEELAMGIGCIDLNPSDEKELDELLEDLTIS